MKIMKLALRSLFRFRMYSLINISGLALSLACTILIFRYVFNELTVDHFLEKLDRIYLTTLEFKTRPDEQTFTHVFDFTGDETFNDITKHSGIELRSDFIQIDRDNIEINNLRYDASTIVADSNFLKIMNYPIIEGIAQLSDIQGALITKTFAAKIFGEQNPIGKTFLHSRGDIYKITGIIGTPSTQSSLQFDLLIPAGKHHIFTYNRNPQTILLLYPNVDYLEINKQHQSFASSDITLYNIRYQLYPFKNIYFGKDIISRNFNHSVGNYFAIMLLSGVGILILLIGIINFTNIYTVVILKRGKEFGVKKVFGGENRNLFNQIWVENIFLVLFALIIGLIIIGAINPLMEKLLGMKQNFISGFDLLLCIGFILFIPLMTTAFPYYKYSRSNPVTSIQNIGKAGGLNLFRRLFLCFQYILTMLMIIVSLFFLKQLHFMLHTSQGYRTKGIIKVSFYTPFNNDKNNNDYIEQNLKACPFFDKLSYGYSPNEILSDNFQIRTSDGEYQQTTLVGASNSWLDLFDIELKEGQLWTDEMAETPMPLILSESALKLLQIIDYKNTRLETDIVNMNASTDIGELGYVESVFQFNIIGVVKDFFTSSLSQQAYPVVIYRSSARKEFILASIFTGYEQEAIEFLEKLHNETIGGDFSYSFVEDEVHEMYKEDEKVAAIYSVFTFISILISILGLFGMSLFDIQKRYKEIAIRKVNGATVITIIGMFVKKYFVWLSISFVIAAPLSWFVIHQYLKNYALQTPVSWWLFAIAFLITAGVSFLTLLYQVNKAANINPAEVVKSE